MTSLAPRSAIISAEISPVKAPKAAAAAAQSCPPIATADPFAATTAAPISVAGGHTATSHRAEPTPATTALSSAMLDVSPFIFQLPAASRRRAAIVPSTQVGLSAAGVGD